MRRLLALALLLVLAGCGGTERVREPAVVVAGDQQAQAQEDRPLGSGDAVRIAVVTHGQASSPFWAIVRNGATAAGRQMDVLVDYRAPDIYNLERQKALIDDAVASRPDGLVVSLPEPGVVPAIRRAVKAGVPVVMINSGESVSKRLGALAFVGQPETRAGYEAGKRLLAAGVRHALCVNHRVSQTNLDDRCRGLARAMREAGGSSLVLSVDDQSPVTPGRIQSALAGGRIDGLLTLNATTAMQALQARSASGRHTVVATFDLSPEVLEAIKGGQLRFAVDQQAYLQGYLPVVMLAEKARYGLFPAQGGVVPTGPNFVTKDDADKVIELSRRSIR